MVVAVTTYKGAWFAATPFYLEEEEGEEMTGYSGETRVCVNASGKTDLKPRTERRAVVNVLIDEFEGCAAIKHLEEHFGFDVTSVVEELVGDGWLEVQP